MSPRRETPEQTERRLRDIAAAALESGPMASLEGIRMRPVSTGELGEIGAETLFTFGQRGDLIHARYAGGSVRLGFLVGTRSGNRLAWRYAQIDHAGRLDGGHSLCELSPLPDGRMRLAEHFTWESRSGSGTNLLEQIA